MTLEEKVAQMMCVWQEKAQKLVDAEGNFDYFKAHAAFKEGNGVGQVGQCVGASYSSCFDTSGKFKTVFRSVTKVYDSWQEA